MRSAFTGRRTLLLLSCFALGPGLWTSAAEDVRSLPQATHFFTSEDYGLSGWNQDMVEDSRGNVYVANDKLLRFDGVRWEVIETPGLFDIVSLTWEGDDRLWVGGVGEIGYVEADEAGVPRFTRLTEKLGDHELREVWRIFVKDEGVFFVSVDSVLCWDGEGFRIWPFETEVRLLGFEFEGAVHVHARGDGLYRFEDGEFRRVVDGEATLEGAGIIGMHRRRDGGVLCLTTNSLFMLDDGGLTRLRTPADEMFKENYPVATASGDGGVIGVGNLNGGVSFIDEDGDVLGEVEQSGPVGLGPSLSIRATVGGGWWVSTATGVFRFSDAGRTRFVVPGGAASTGFVCFARLDETIHAANGGDIVRLGEDDCFASLSEFPPDAAVLSLLADSGFLFVASAGRLVVLKGGREFQSLEGRGFRSLNRSPDGAGHVVYSANEGFGQLRLRDGVWEVEWTTEDFGTVHSIAKLRGETVAIGTFVSGLFLADWKKDSGEAPDFVRSGVPALENGYVRVHASGGQVLALSESGLFRASEEDPEFRHDPLLGDSIGENVYMIKMVGDFDTGGVYVSLEEDNPLSRQATRIGRITMDEREQLHWEELYLPGIGQAGGVTELLFEDGPGGGQLWVGGKACILRYDMGRYEPSALPRAVLGAVRSLAGDVTFWGGFGPGWPGFEWDFSRRSLHFDFTAPGNLEPDLRFQSRLVGFEDDWTAPSGNGFREITNLMEGAYTLEVRALDSFGRPGPVAAYAFTLRPPWFRTAAAYAGYLISAVVAVGAFVRWRTARLRRQTEELETVVKERTAELEQRNLELVEANGVKDDFLANMSHEIRNPLNGILGIARLLKERGAESGETQAVNHLDCCATHLNQLLTEVLDFARLESGRMEPRSRRFQVGRVLEEVRLMHEEMAAAKRLDLRFETAECRSFWLGDPVFLRQILINLVSNAIKYTLAGGVAVRFSFREVGGRAEARFEVEDTGPGIPPEMRSKVFEKFTRGARAGESEVSGTGLGLAIASEMARFLGGTVELESEVGRGSNFILTVPFGIDGRAAEAPDAVVDSNSDVLAGRRVLVVDDLDFNRFIGRQLLEHFGASVEEAGDGDAALEALRAGSFDLVLMDLNMPGRSGLEVAAAWRAGHPGGDGPMLVALSAYVSDEMVNRALASGFDHFLEKPLDPAALFALLPQTAEHSTATPPVAPRDLLDYLGDGSPYSRERVLERYRQTLQELASAVRVAVDAGDGEAARQCLHKFLGVANVVRAPSVLAAATCLREHLLRQDWSAARGAASELEAVAGRSPGRVDPQ